MSFLRPRISAAPVPPRTTAFCYSFFTTCLHLHVFLVVVHDPTGGVARQGCPDLIHLMEEGEEKEDFFKLPVEEVLLRWFNHHLR